jgi:hypothetical protein
MNHRGIIPLLFLFLLIPSASCIGIGASPDQIDFGMVGQEIYVINTGSETEQVLLTANGVNLSIEPRDFVLEAKKSGVVKVSVDSIDILKAGEHTGSILITARPPGNTEGLGFGAGVKIPVSFVVKENSNLKIFAAVVSLIAIFAIVLLWVRFNK